MSWADGPTVATMQAHVKRLPPAFPDLGPAALAYSRTVQPGSVGLVMLGNVAAGRPAFGAHGELWLLEQDLDAVDYPERGEPEELERAGLLLDRHGGLAAALRAELSPLGNVRALHSRRVKPGKPQQ